MVHQVIDPVVSQILRAEPALGKFHRYLLVMTHPRSYSTLLCHILGSHPRICGYAESKIVYQYISDFVKLNWQVREAGCYRSGAEYVLDKLVYNHFDVSDAVLGHERVTPIFMVRGPEAAITSHARMILREHEGGIVNWGIAGSQPSFAVETATALYIQRLVTLPTIGARLEPLGNRGIFLTSESLMDATLLVFQLIERMLNLSEPLRETYATFEKTGVAGAGDTSALIRCGRIVRERAEDGERSIVIPPELLDFAHQAYARCLEGLRGSPGVVGLER